jgi:type I restriction enzyme, S subunit
MSELQLPKTKWPTAPLDDLCDIVIGRTPSRNRPEFWGGEHPWLSIADMNQGRQIRITKERITALGVTESGSRLIRNGTVLLSFKLSIGKVAVADIDTYTNEAIAALPILTPEKLSRDFLFWTLRSIRLDEEVDVAAKGKTLNSKKLARLQIPLPPLDEQKRIAAVLEKADALRRHRQESLQLTEKLLQSVFIDMFGDPATNPKEWAIEQLGSLTTKGDSINYGVVQPGGDWPNGIPLVRAGDIANPHPDPNRLKRINPEIDAAYNRSRLKGGELLIGCVGSVGATCIAPKTWNGANIARAVARVNLRSDIEPEFLLQLLRTKALQRYFTDEIRVVAQPTLNIKQIKQAPIILPPAPLRSKFAQIFRAATQLHSDRIDSETDLHKLFTATQQRAFRGELDLSRLFLEEDVEALERAVDKLHKVVHVTLPKDAAPAPAKRAFIAPPDLEKTLDVQDALAEKGEPLAWSADYFQYRILGRVLEAPYCFTKIWNAVQQRMPEACYEAVKDLVFEYIADGRLRQRFDKKQKALVFFPRRA